MKRLACLSLLFLMGFSSADAVLYSVIDLGTLGGSYSEAASINSSGTVVGRATIVGDTEMHAFSYSNGMMTDLGTAGNGFTVATGINDSGTIVGLIDTGGSGIDAFRHAGGLLTDQGIATFLSIPAIHA